MQKNDVCESLFQKIIINIWFEICTGAILGMLFNLMNINVGIKSITYGYGLLSLGLWVFII